MPDKPRLLMIVGAATPPGRLAAAVAAAAEPARAKAEIDILNLAETPIETLRRPAARPITARRPAARWSRSSAPRRC